MTACALDLMTSPFKCSSTYIHHITSHITHQPSIHAYVKRACSLCVPMCVVWYLWLCVPCGVCGEVECGLGAIAVGPCSDRLIQIQGLIQKHSHVMQVHTRGMRDQILPHTGTQHSIEEGQGHRKGRRGGFYMGLCVYVCVYVVVPRVLVVRLWPGCTCPA